MEQNLRVNHIPSSSEGKILLAFSVMSRLAPVDSPMI